MEGTFYVDPNRRELPETGIYVRALDETKWVSADIVTLTANSLSAWLRSRGGNNPFAEQCVGLLLGHEADEVPSSHQ